MQQLLYFTPMEQPPCDVGCGDHEEICAASGGCVPKCTGDQSLDPLECTCVPAEAVANSERGDHEEPPVAQGQPDPGPSERWQFLVPEGHVLIMSTHSATVNSVPMGTDWVLTAFPEHTPVTMIVDDGSWTIVDNTLAQSYFCGQLASTGPGAIPYSTSRSQGLAEWGADPCPGGFSDISAFSAYQSPYYPHRLRWDDSWSVTMSNASWLGNSGRGYDQIQLKNGTSVVAVTGTDQWSGNGQHCLDGVAEGIASLAGSSNVVQTSDADDHPLDRLPGYEQAAVYRYTYTHPEGWAHDRLVYLNCITLSGASANIVFLFDAPAGHYDEQLQVVNQTLVFELPVHEA